MYLRHCIFIAALLWAGAARAGGVLVVRSQELAPYRAVTEGFTAALRRPVQELPLESAGAAGLERALAAHPEVVLAIGLEAARSVASRGVPVVCALVPAPEVLGRAVSAVPMFSSPERQLEAMRAVLPDARRLGVVINAARPPADRGAYVRAARAAGFELLWGEARSAGDLSVTARELARQVDVLWLLPDAQLITPQSFRFLVELSFERKVPLAGFSQSMVKAGALLAVEPGYAQMGERAALLAQQLLAGGNAKRPASPPADPLYLNTRAAAILGVSLPDAVRAQAARSFE